MRCSCRDKALDDLACRRWSLSWVDDDLYRAHKRCRVAFNFSTIPVEDLVLLLKLFDCTKAASSHPNKDQPGQICRSASGDQKARRAQWRRGSLLPARRAEYPHRESTAWF